MSRTLKTRRRIRRWIDCWPISRHGSGKSQKNKGRNAMKKLINGVDTVLSESLDGFAAAHADIVTLGAARLFVRRKTLQPGKVALLSGGGSVHEPLHAGFVGHGMLDGAC